MALLDSTPKPDLPRVEGAKGLGGWQAESRRRLNELLAPLPEAVPLALETTESVACDGYRRDRVVFDTEAGMSVPAYFLVPEGRTSPGPAVLAVHGHGPGKALVCGLATTPAPNGDYAVQLARRGYVVLAPDLRGFGERRDDVPGRYICDFNLALGVAAGWSPLSRNLWDMWRAMDVLAGHQLVDPMRIATVGLSYGGAIALFLAATDARVAAAVVSGFFSSWDVSHRVPLNMCGSQVLPGLLGRLEHVDLGALVAPRPLLVETGTEDDIFPEAAASAAVAMLRPAYEASAAGDHLVHDVFAGHHQWHGSLAYPFLDRWLGLGTAPC
jgi:dienelactone hydrolase